MTNIQIRKSVFETNSSSSHSLTLGTAALVSQPFHPATLREGVVEVDLDEYGWEYRRLYTTENKLSYLLTQLTVGCAYGGHAKGSIAELRETDARIDLLCRVVKEHTGCDVKIGRNSGGIDHESVGVALELFNSPESLKQLLFSEDSYIQTGNDNSPPPWVMQTDRGSELTYAPHIAAVPAEYVAVKLTPAERYSLSGVYTSKGALISESFNKALLVKVRKFGIASFVNVKSKGYSHPFEYSSVQSDWAGRLTESNGLSLRISPDFNGDCAHTRGEGYDQTVTLTVMVPASLAKSLTALPETPKVLVDLSDAKSRLAHFRSMAKDNKAASKPDWLKKGLSESRARVAELKSKAQAEGVL